MTVDKSRGAVVPPELRRFEHPQLDDEVDRRVLRQLHRAISLYDGSDVYRELEDAWRDLIGSAHVLSVNSGTSALYSAYYGLDLSPEAEVIIPNFNFFAAATPLIHLGLVPVLADCGPDGNIRAESLESLIGPRTEAISITHLWGYPCDMDRICAIADTHGLALVEDASHAHGATFHGRTVGSFGTVGAWSLQGKKILTAGEGGVLGTNSQTVIDRALLLGHYNKRAVAEVQGRSYRKYAATGVGLNLRMHPLGAALAVHQLEGLERQLEERRETAEILRSTIDGIDGLENTPVSDEVEPSYYAFAIRYVPSEFPGLSRRHFVSALNAEGAVEVDVPGATRTLDSYPFFQKSLIDDFPELVPAVVHDEAALRGSEEYGSTVIKMPTWYGPRRRDYAEAYSAALRKVATDRLILARQ